MNKIIELIDNSPDQITGIIETLDTIAEMLKDYDLDTQSKHLRYISTNLIKIRDKNLGE